MDELDVFVIAVRCGYCLVDGAMGVGLERGGRGAIRILSGGWSDGWRVGAGRWVEGWGGVGRGNILFIFCLLVRNKHVSMLIIKFIFSAVAQYKNVL